MNKLVRAGLGALLVAGVWGATPALADNNEVDREGPCSAGRSEWRLRVKPDDGRLEVRFKVNQHRPSSDVWNVVLTRNGTASSRGSESAEARMASSRCAGSSPTLRGPDTIAGRAREPTFRGRCAKAEAASDIHNLGRRFARYEAPTSVDK